MTLGYFCNDETANSSLHLTTITFTLNIIRVERQPHQPRLVFMGVLQIELDEFGDFGFCRERKTGEPGEKPSDQPTCVTRPELNTCHIGGKH